MTPTNEYFMQDADGPMPPENEPKQEYPTDADRAEKAAYYQAQMARANSVGYTETPYGGAIGTLLPDFNMKAQLLSLAVHHVGVGSRDVSRVMETADKFMDFVYGPKVEADSFYIGKSPVFEPAKHDYSEIISDTLAATDAESEAVRVPGGARVSYAYMMGRIANTHFTYPPACPHMTVAEVTFDNGFTIIGSSAPADPRNFDVKLGQKYALENAMRQAWPLFGFLLCELQHLGADLSDFTVPTSEPSTPSSEPTQAASVHEAIYGKAGFGRTAAFPGYDDEDVNTVIGQHRRDD